MLHRVLIASLLLTSCAFQERRSPERTYSEAKQLQRNGDLSRALLLVKGELQHFPQQRRSILYYKLRLLESELLQSLSDIGGAASLRDAPIPDAPEFANAIAIQRLDQGVVKYGEGHYQQAKALLDDAAAIAKKSGERELIAAIEQRRGTVLLKLGDSTQAETSYRASLRLANEAGDSYLRASAIGNLGYLAMEGARYDEAIGWFEQTLPESKSKGVIALTLTNLGSCYFFLGDVDRALTYFERAGRLWEEMGKVDAQQVNIGSIGDVLRAKADLPGARRDYGRALELARRVGDRYWAGVWLNRLATTSLDMNDVAAAENYNSEAKKLQDDLGDKVTRLWPPINQARIHESRSEFAAAEILYSQVADTEVDDPAPCLEAGERLAVLLAGRGRLPEADAQFQRAMTLADRSRAKLLRDDSKLSYFSSVIRLHREYIEFLFSHNRTNEALLVADANRARLLSETASPEANRAGMTPAEKVARWQRAAEASNTVLLSYWLAPKRSILWAISPSRISAWSLPPELEIRRLVEAHTRSILELRDPLEREKSSAAAELYGILVGPVQPAIRKGSRVGIVPDGCLHDLNFETLVSGEGQPHYWIDDVTISILPSFRGLLRSKLHERRANELLLIGDPVAVNDVQFPKLANAGRELADIREQFAGDKIVTLTGKHAYPNAYREAQPQRFSIIHFASHATADRESPLDSAVILTPSEDGFKLYAREIIRQPIRADLVTISACRSAGARTYSGEGLVGFAWAFLKAGARNVVAGLWEVDDASTTTIMQGMYGAIRRGCAPTDSLRAAKLAILRSSGAVRKPYYWAPFETFTGSLQ